MIQTRSVWANICNVCVIVINFVLLQLKKSTSVAEKWENFTSAIEPFQSQRTQVKRFQMKELDDVISGLEGEISELEVRPLKLFTLNGINVDRL